MTRKRVTDFCCAKENLNILPPALQEIFHFFFNNNGRTGLGWIVRIKG